MNRKLHIKSVLLGAAILFAFAYVGGLLIAKERLADLRATLEVQASKQQVLLATIAETTARNGADTTTESIVKDCTIEERQEFDLLLGKLDAGLPQTELSTLERLFGRCGSFYAERKAVMVARLEREVEVYHNYVEQLNQLQSVDTDSYQVDLWKQLALDETYQSEAFRQLVVEQDKIITALVSGKQASSPEIKEILDDVKSAQQTLASSSAAATEKRRLLLSL